LFYEISFAESFSTPGTRVTSGSDVALGKGLFAGPAVSRALCRELPLGKACAEWKPSCADSMLLSAEAANPVVLHAMFWTLPEKLVFVQGGNPDFFYKCGGNTRYKCLL
jgi:hypothetical protein